MIQNNDRNHEKDYQIQALTPSDCSRLLAFYRSLPEAVTQLYEPFGKPDEAVLQKHLDETHQGRHVSLGLVRENGDIEGHGMIFNVDGNQPIFGIGLKPKAHGQGWGRRLSEAVLRIADDRKRPLVTLTVVKANTGAKALYEKLGFRLRGEATFRSQDDSYYMERRLGAPRRTTAPAEK